MDSNSNRMTASSLMTAASLKDLQKIRCLTLVLVLFHIASTSIMMVMGFSQAKERTAGVDARNSYSTSVVCAAFVGLMTVIWTAVAAWEVKIESGPKKQLPEWTWHDRHLILCLVHLFTLSVCMCPAITLYLIRQIGYGFWELATSDLTKTDIVCGGQILLNCVTQENLDVIRVGAFFHVVCMGLVCIADICSIVVSTHALKNIHREQQSDVAKEEDEDAFAEPTRSVKCMTAVKLFVGLLYFVDMIVLQATLPYFNSVLFLSSLVILVLNLVFAYKVKSLFSTVVNSDLEAWLESWRVLSCIAIFISWSLWWVTMIFYLLIGIFRATGIMSKFSELQENERALIGLALGLFFVTVLLYVALLRYHERCMTTQNNLSSTKLMDRFNASSASLSTAGRSSLKKTGHNTDSLEFVNSPMRDVSEGDVPSTNPAEREVE